MYRVRVSKKATKFLKAQNAKTRKRLHDRMKELANDAHPPDCEPVKSLHNAFRLKEGDYRIVYKVSQRELLILVVRIANRKDIYKIISRL